MLLNCGVGADSWESLGMQGDPTSQSERKSTLTIHWKDRCWSSNTLATSCKELTHWKRNWCWERLKAGREGGHRGWDGCMASSTQWTWVQANSEVKWSEVAQSCPTLCDPMDSSLPDSAIHGIFQARILEWAAISFSRGSSQPRDQTRVSCIADRYFTVWATREAHRRWWRIGKSDTTERLNNNNKLATAPESLPL